MPTPPSFSIRRAVPEDVNRLIEALDAEILAVYPPETCELPTGGELDGGGAVIQAAFNAQEMAVACGAVRVLGPGIGEIKRMYVSPEARGHGIARRLLSALENDARIMNLKTLRLETGDKQFNAILFYEKAGFVRIPPYAPFHDNACSICYEKSL